MRFPRSLTYTARVHLQLAAETGGGSVSCRRIAGEGNMPQRYLLKVLRKPLTQELVRPMRGSDATGFKSLRRPQETSLLDPVEAVEGPSPTELPEGAGLM